MKIDLLSIPFCVILLFACNNKDLSPEILGSSIESNHKRQELYIPYADSVELKELAQNKKVLDFELARKITLLEMNETGFVQDMGLERLSFSTKSCSNIQFGILAEVL